MIGGIKMKCGFPLALAAALVLVAAGAAMLLRQMPVPATGSPPASTEGGAVSGDHPPGKWGLPAPAGAFNFHSAEAPDGRGSSSFSLKGATAAEVLAFYRRKLKREGLLLLESGPIKQEVRLDAGGASRVIGGIRASWEDRREGRRVSLNAFDLRQASSDVQAVLSWRPHSTIRERPAPGAKD